MAALTSALVACPTVWAQPTPSEAPPAGGPPTGGPPPGISDKLTLLKPLAAAAPGSRPPSTDPRNFEGTYTMDQAPFPRQDLPLTPKAAAERAVDAQRMKDGKPTGGLGAICRPQPTFTLGSDLFPGEVTQTNDQVVLLNEEHRTRFNIYLNRDHPKDIKPTYFGDSVGHWEGDTLVVDTIGFNGREPTISTRAHVVTRIRKVEAGRRLEITSTLTDPINYTQPIVTTFYSNWNPSVQVLEFQCEENLEGAQEGLTVGG